MTQLLENERPGKLADVAYEEDPKIQKKRAMFDYWIDYAHVEQVIPVFVAIIAIVLIFPAVFSSITETKIYTASQLVPLTFESQDTSLNVDLSFSQLMPYKKFIDVKASFVRESIDKVCNVHASINYKVNLLRRLRTVGEATGKVAELLTFESGEGETRQVSLFLAATNRSYDVLDFLATVQSDSTDVKGMRVSWTTANQKTYQFLAYGMTSLLALSVACYHSYAITFKWFLYLDNIMSMVLIGTAGAAVNPLIYVFNIDIQFVNVFLAVFLAWVKFHALYKFREVKVEDDGLNVNAAVCGFMCVYLLMNCYASIAHENRVILGLSMQPAEVVRMLLHIIYAAILYFYVWKVKQADEGAHELRVNSLVTSITIVVVTEAIADIVLPILGIAQENIVCDLLKGAAANGYVMAFSMFFKRKLKKYGIYLLGASFELDNDYHQGQQGGMTLLDDE